ncbi:hypothetical protein GCM10010156_60770 [Planobispora rosea]|uniref:Uncharacterized protein n=1 Tax=Planobispora rosea TaxID=35762 RepID=A0A8J3S5U5_PLARO|nr:hypothetical protein [Planobispora rosea]GGS94351.1 hypothetical protein GCM10010156_60770 [Planobispora rosea]GIH87329.1 hypothetical protein Pro02_57370 [Planobispora rosea]
MSETPRYVSGRADERTGGQVTERPTEEAAETEKAARPGGSAARIEQPDAKELADEEAAPEQQPEGSELVGRGGDNELEGNPQRVAASQRFWDGATATSRIDEAMPRGQDEDPAGTRDADGGTTR